MTDNEFANTYAFEFMIDLLMQKMDRKYDRVSFYLYCLT